MPLHAFCPNPRGPCLVYEIAPGGNLEDRLLRTPEGLHRLRLLGWAAAPAPLGWGARLRCVRDAARGLVYLHRLTSDKGQRVLHRDVKASRQPSAPPLTLFSPPLSLLAAFEHPARRAAARVPDRFRPRQDYRY